MHTPLIYDVNIDEMHVGCGSKYIYFLLSDAASYLCKEKITVTPSLVTIIPPLVEAVLMYINNESMFSHTYPTFC
jgi:hypothetical protein